MGKSNIYRKHDVKYLETVRMSVNDFFVSVEGWTKWYIFTHPKQVFLAVKTLSTQLRMARESYREEEMNYKVSREKN